VKVLMTSEMVMLREDLGELDNDSRTRRDDIMCSLLSTNDIHDQAIRTWHCF